MKLKLLLPLLLLLLFLLSSPCQAARKRTRKPKAQTAYVSRGVKCKVGLRSDHLGLLISCYDFTDVASVRYNLVYQSNQVTRGAGGTTQIGDTSAKQLLFGTCSGAVCTFHENISNARLSIVSTLSNGTTVLKPYRIKVLPLLLKPSIK